MWTSWWTTGLRPTSRCSPSVPGDSRRRAPRGTATPTPRVTRSASSTSRRGRRRSTGRPSGPHPGDVEDVTDQAPAPQAPHVHEARRLFPATADRVYLNTAAVGLASLRLPATLHPPIEQRAHHRLVFTPR